MATPIMDGVRFIARHARTVDQLSARIASHDGGIAIEAKNQLPVLDALQQHAASGRPLWILTRGHRQVRDLVPGAATIIHDYSPGNERSAFMHSGIIAFDSGVDGTREPEAWVTNFDGSGRDRAALAMVVHGAPAEHGFRLVRSSIEDAPGVQALRIDDAAEAGLLVNDPLADRWPYREANQRIIRGAANQLDVLVKEIIDTPMRHALRDARAAHTNVAAWNVKEFADRSYVPHWQLKKDWRTNLVFGDGEATVGTSTFEPYATRDAGLLLGGRAALEARDAAYELIDDPDRDLRMKFVGRWGTRA